MSRIIYVVKHPVPEQGRDVDLFFVAVRNKVYKGQSQNGEKLYGNAGFLGVHVEYIVQGYEYHNCPVGSQMGEGLENEDHENAVGVIA